MMTVEEGIFVLDNGWQEELKSLIDIQVRLASARHKCVHGTVREIKSIEFFEDGSVANEEG
jgi:hypothetical protein